MLSPQQGQTSQRGPFDRTMQRRRPAHRPNIVIADMGDLMGEDACDLLACHAAQQTLGQDNRGVFRSTQRVGIHF